MLSRLTVAVVYSSFVSLSDGLRRQKAGSTSKVHGNKTEMTVQGNQSLSFDPCDLVNDNKHVSKQCSCKSSKGRLELECSAEIFKQDLGVKFELTMCDIPPRATVVASHNDKEYPLIGQTLSNGDFLPIPGMFVPVLPTTHVAGVGLRLKQSGDQKRTFGACLDACYDAGVEICAGNVTGPWCFLEHTFDLEHFCGAEYCHTQTTGTCAWWGCDKSRGETECLSGKCFCKGDSCTSKDRQKCI
eukprot:TRINITY_DN7043_c0_g5_i1.p1 TRINITY_DN7043_c0_g5~~TRINITY_DN7043_c0_g5_i1.p1  ORF type:complete len:243 (+),score=31.37 TRINITY_DN7043_c0_g5_i1:42-770(+)